MIKTIARRLMIPALMGATVVLTGCASALNTASHSDFACASDNGCPTPFEVYRDTNNAPPSVRDGRTPEKWRNHDAAKTGERAAKPIGLDLTAMNPAAVLKVPSDPTAQPVREASQVMRVWIAPWIDQGDNLNWTGYVYTEVTPKRWSFGEQEVRHQGMAPQFLMPKAATN